AAAAGPAPGSGDSGTEWSDPATTVPARSRMPHPGPRAWRTSHWPR
ncbi:acyl-CoA carboxylase subunit epsilon, partial [Streptomyces lydicus]